jgi:hypothetical protein
MSVKLEDLVEPAKSKAIAALDEMKTAGIQVVVTYTLRTFAEQAALYAQGREPLPAVNSLRANAGLPAITEYLGKDKKVHSDNDYTVTNADGVATAQGGKGRSVHQLGKAIDIVPDMDSGEKQVPGWPAPSDPRWKKISDIMKKHGFEWGGDWTIAKDGIDPDYPHYQLA